MLAPTGTIAFMMDCDTTGIEPDIALVKYKKLVGGGMLKIVNQYRPRGPEALGYDQQQIDDDHAVHRRARHDRGRAAPEGRAPRRSSTARSKPQNGTRSIHYMGHIR